jgi:hypothetical protein
LLPPVEQQYAASMAGCAGALEYRADCGMGAAAGEQPDSTIPSTTKLIITIDGVAGGRINMAGSLRIEMRCSTSVWSISVSTVDDHLYCEDVVD